MKPVSVFLTFAAGSFVALAPAFSAPQDSAGWTMQRSDGGIPFAMSPRTEPEGIRMAMTCIGPRPLMVVLFDGEGERRLDFAMMTEEGEAVAPLEFQAKRRTYTGDAPSQISELLTGEAKTAVVSASQGQYFNLSLIGARAQVTKALEKCWTRPAQPSIKPAPRITGAVGPLGIAPGHYVAAASACSDPMEVFYYDGKRAGMVDPEGKIRVGPVGKVSRNPDGSQYLNSQEIALRKLSGGRISLTIQDITPPMRICSAAELPREWRVK